MHLYIFENIDGHMITFVAGVDGEHSSPDVTVLLGSNDRYWCHGECTDLSTLAECLTYVYIVYNVHVYVYR